MAPSLCNHNAFGGGGIKFTYELIAPWLQWPEVDHRFRAAGDDLLPIQGMVVDVNYPDRWATIMLAGGDRE